MPHPVKKKKKKMADFANGWHMFRWKIIRSSCFILFLTCLRICRGTRSLSATSGRWPMSCESKTLRRLGDRHRTNFGTWVFPTKFRVVAVLWTWSTVRVSRSKWLMLVRRSCSKKKKKISVAKNKKIMTRWWIRGWGEVINPLGLFFFVYHIYV